MMAGDTNEQADIQTEIARIWSELAAVNARLELTTTEQDRMREALVPAFGHPPTDAELHGWCDGIGMAVHGMDAMIAAFGRLYRAAHAVSGGLHRECDHAVYLGSLDAVDALAAELEDARMRVGAGLLDVTNEEGFHQRASMVGQPPILREPAIGK